MGRSIFTLVMAFLESVSNEGKLKIINSGFLGESEESLVEQMVDNHNHLRYRLESFTWVDSEVQ